MSALFAWNVAPIWLGQTNHSSDRLLKQWRLIGGVVQRVACDVISLQQQLKRTCCLVHVLELSFNSANSLHTDEANEKIFFSWLADTLNAGREAPAATLRTEGSASEVEAVTRADPKSCAISVPGGADDNLMEGGEMKFVCKPGARNITVIFQPLLRYSDLEASRTIPK